MRKQRGITFSNTVWKDLKRRGFIFLRPELLEHSAQVDIFSNAKTIIATHGAGLSNIVFCPPGTKVFELFNKTLSTHAFYTLAHFGGLDYSCAVLDPLEIDKSVNPIDNQCHLDSVSYFEWIDKMGI